MDAFEQLVSEILWAQGYWVRTSVKVELTKEEKRVIGRHSAPRWELDVVAFSPRENLLRVVECKSYIDSLGVQLAAFRDQPSKSDRYKLFNDKVLRHVVFDRLKAQLAASGACRDDATVRLELACGKIYKEGDRAKLKAHFDSQGWRLLDEPWLRAGLERMAQGSYENQVSAVVAKLLLRGSIARPAGSS